MRQVVVHQLIKTSNSILGTFALARIDTPPLCHSGCAGDPGVRDGEDWEAIHRASAVRPGRVLRRLYVRHAADLHPVPGSRPHRGAPQVRRGPGTVYPSLKGRGIKHFKVQQPYLKYTAACLARASRHPAKVFDLHEGRVNR